MRIARTLPVLLLCVLLVPAQAGAQGINAGIKAGLTESRVNDVENASLRSAFVGGAYVGGFLKVVALQAEVLYAQRKFSEITGTVFQQDFVEIPLLLGLRLRGDPFFPMFYAGASAAFELKCSAEGLVDQTCEDLGVVPTSPQWNFLLGVGVDVYVGPVILTVDGRFNLGLSALQEGNPDRKWRSFYLMAGIGLPLKRPPQFLH
jgi:hypothetical protein